MNPRTYPVLEAGKHEASRSGSVALAVMAKAPRPGKVKTRLQPPLTAAEAAALNICFLRDTTTSLATVPGAAPMVCYTPVGDEEAFAGLLPEGFALIAQRGDGFGERLLLAATDILACGFGAVCLIDSDSPTVPAEAYRQAVEALQRPGDRVVLGPSADGGYYLIGMKAAHPEPFERITWSTSSVHAETVERVREAGLELVELPTWYDVDDALSLAVLEAELLEETQPDFGGTAGTAELHGFDAQLTREFLLRRRQSEAGSTGDGAAEGSRSTTSSTTTEAV